MPDDLTENEQLLEDIVQETVNGDSPLNDATMERWSALTHEELFNHAWSYVGRWLDAYSERETRLTEEALVGLYISGLITGRLYEEQREKG